MVMAGERLRLKVLSLWTDHIRDKLGWKPEVGFKELVKMMVESDLAEEGKE